MMSIDEQKHREGDVYRTVVAGGHTFTLCYGYYEEYERGRGEPVVVYPDLVQDPLYSKDGFRVVTAVQDICDMFSGREDIEDDACCSDCIHYLNPRSCIDICTCEQNRATNN